MIGCLCRSPPVFRFQEFATKSQELVTLSRAEIFNQGWQSLSFHYSMYPCADAWQRSPWGWGWGGILICSICWLLWYKYFHHDPFPATNMMSVNTDLGGDVHGWLFWAGLSRFQHPRALMFILFHTLFSGFCIQGMDFSGSSTIMYDTTGAGWDYGARVELCPPPLLLLN